MIVIGLTGSLGMGKTTTAGIFKDEGNAAVLDADQQVHELYGSGGAAVKPIADKFPDVIVSGGISRPLLSQKILADPNVLKFVEGVVHPLVREGQQEFLKSAKEEGREFAILDVPLLIESGTAEKVDAVVVATCPPDVCRSRVMERPGMTNELFERLTKRQAPEKTKIERADYTVPTTNMDDARQKVKFIIEDLRKKMKEGSLKMVADKI